MSRVDESAALALMDNVERLGAATATDIPVLLACLGHERKSLQRRAAAILAKLPEQRGALLAALGSDEPRQRWGAAYALSQQEVPAVEAIDVLLKCLGSHDGDVRWAARDILMRWQPWIDVGERLLEVALHGSPEQRKMAAYSLRDLDRRPARAEAVVVQLLEDKEAGVRIAAMTCLQRMASHKAEAATAVARRLSDADSGVRRAAAATLGSIGYRGDAICRVLEEASRSPDISLRRAAEGALQKLADGS